MNAKLKMKNEKCKIWSHFVTFIKGREASPNFTFYILLFELEF
jgi:hypothetical protein